jgi:hypothetical protein
VFPKSGWREQLSENNGTTCVLLPNTYNRIDFDKRLNTHEDSNSVVYIFFSREPKRVPKGRFPSFNAFYEEMKRRDFIITHFEIGIYSRQ